ncbi:BTB/POZ domain-containing protein 9-like isoform X2 [Sitodiplosis mosellana]|uniref:BTB/POZ domain-containing protein 9-like isoform X2 n=1 Tax=Sitodiplosis mosellana TaxID=263140 RepID=UPI002445251E|nr:BTB/POZ domain-containing protein 9-like isoform X2 [Sitodiplosis mosellana]
MVINDIQDNGDIDQSTEILQLLNDICMNNEHADVSFIVENTEIPAHKMILSLRSSYFHSLFCGGFAEAKQAEIKLEVPLDAFKAILKYIYTGCLSLAALESHQIIEIYDLAEQYGFDTLNKIILEYLTVNLTSDNCVSILNAAYLYSLDDLQAACMNFIDFNSTELLDHDTFNALSLTSLCTVLKRDTFYALEIDIFRAICNWSTNNPDTDIKVALSTVRWTELSMHQYLNIVIPSNILDPTQLLQVMIASSNTGGRIQCRNSNLEKDVEENIATAEYGAKTISGENPSALLSGNFTDYDVNKGSTFHPVNANRIHDGVRQQPLDSCIIVDLGKLRFINNINFLLMDKDSRSYSYYIDVSLDGIEYTRLFDHTKHYYRSWQYLYFQSRPIRFIKLVGTQATDILRKRSGFCYDRGYNYADSYDSFDIVGLQAMFTTINYPNLVDGVMKPTKNVANIEHSAIVVKGVGGNNMLNENPDEFTCHEKGSHILLQFNQPYYIDSLRMLLGNNMNHLNKYSFCIETSMDKINWKMAVNKRNEYLSNWQEFDFEPHSAIFIRITGTRSDVSFICTYFECPCNPRRPKLKRPLQR